MVHGEDHMQPLQFEIESYVENVGRLPNTDDNQADSDQQFEWMNEEPNFVNEDNPCMESFCVKSPLMNRNQRYD
jgi:hypothetical protein